MDYIQALRFFNESELATKIKVAEHNAPNIFDGSGIYFLRCDGRHFKSFTKGLKKPFDKILRNTMERTMIALCEEVQGSVIGFTQSDEITVMFKKQNENSQLSYGGRRTKIETSAAASCTLFFNKFFMEEVQDAIDKKIDEYLKDNILGISEIKEIVNKDFEIYTKKFLTATFDARCFEMSTPMEAQQVVIWRILDCYKNAIQMIARSNFSNKELHEKKTYQMVSMLKDKGITISSFPIRNIYGAFCCKEEKLLYKGTNRECVRSKYTLKDTLSSVFTLDCFRNDVCTIGEIIKVKYKNEIVFGQVVNLIDGEEKHNCGLAYPLLQVKLVDGTLVDIAPYDVI